MDEKTDVQEIAGQAKARRPIRLIVLLVVAAGVLTLAVAWRSLSTGAVWCVSTLRSGVQLAMAAPQLLGADGPRTYLILAQNEDELRPTGGFITAAGLVTFDRGRIARLEFRDSYRVDDLRKPYPEPPPPLRDIMMADLWLFRDINWSPDFPTAARQAAEVYEYGRGVRVDGVIAVDQAALRYVLEGLGPVTIEATGETVGADNVVEAIRTHWQPAPGQGLTGDWWLQRKSFLGDMATAIRGKMEGGEGVLAMPRLAWAMKHALDEKHILAYLAHVPAAEALQRLGWDGSILRRQDSDYLMVVDANVGFNKASALVTKQIDYRVILRSDGSASANAVVTYQHGGARRDGACRPEVRYDPVYTQMMERCLWDYVRLYVPEGAVLETSPGIVVPGDAMLNGQPTKGVVDSEAAEGGTISFGLLFVLPPGETTGLQYAYELPAGKVAKRIATDEWGYDLLVQKQPGTTTAALEVTVTLPEGASLVASQPVPTAVTGLQATYRFELVQDRGLSLRYRVAQAGSGE
jgi:Protein of unknown function (DUF4012)